MNEAQTKAWNCLREDEKQSLFLQISGGKSAWEAGTIMKRSHYKYIEIRERSQKFFKMFTEFFELHESIFRPGVPCKDTFKDYIEGCIEKRLTRKEAAFYSGDSTQVFAKVRSNMLRNNLQKLRTSTDPWDKDTFTLLIEFDRWNNFRILPRMYQAPSAYKRRANEKQKIYIRYLNTRFPKWAHKKIIDRFKCSPTRHEKYWVALISREKYPKTGYYVFPVKPSDELLFEMSKFFIYVFKTQDDADTFGFMVDSFIDKTASIPSGQRFWGEFRSIVEEAVNYKQVSFIDFNMKTLDMAYGRRARNAKEYRDKNLKGIQRVKDDQFYTDIPSTEPQL